MVHSPLMKVIQHSSKHHVLRFDAGDDVLAILTEHCASHNIFAGAFQAIGAASYVKLSWYDTDTKSYEHLELSGKLEIASMTGNASLKEGKMYMHAHGCFGDRELNVKGGHITQVIAHPTCELVFTVLPETMTRSHDEACGLHLLS